MFALREGGSTEIREVDGRAILNGPNKAGWNNHQTNPGYPAIPQHLFLFHKFWGDLTCFCFNDLWHILWKIPFLWQNLNRKKNIPLFTTLIFTSSQGIKMLNSDIISWLVGCFRFQAERSVRIWSSGGCFDICFEPKRMPHGKKTPFMCPHGKNQRQNSKEIPPWKLTWHWKIPNFQ